MMEVGTAFEPEMCSAMSPIIPGNFNNETNLKRTNEFKKA
jgi:hypothetical protein